MVPTSEGRLVPSGALILVTGANGFLGSHVVEAFLLSGYKVRGTVRSLDKLSNLQQRWDEKFPQRFEAVEIVDLTKAGAYDQALAGASALVHTAADVTFANDYEKVIDGAIESTLNALRAASAQPSIKRVVITSSYICAAMPQIGHDGSHFDEKSWNDQIIEITKSVPTDHPLRGRFIYMASKVESEKAAWRFVAEQKPSFALNTVLPGFCFGKLFDPVTQRGSTSAIARDVFLMKSNEIAKTTPIQAFCSASDIGLLHVGAAVLEGFENKRFFGVSDILTWNEILSIFRELYPDRQTYEDFDERRKEISYYDTASSLAVLEALGQKGWKPIEEAIRENLEEYS